MIANLPHHTNRLILRTLRVADATAFHSYRSRADVAALQGWSPMSAAEALAYLYREDSNAGLVPDSWRQIGIAAADSDVLIGDIGIHLAADARSAEFGLSIHPDRQGQGLGTEAVQALIRLLFMHTSVDRIIASADARNTACICLLTKAGMRETETRAAEFKGESCTEIIFAMCRNVG
jgi:[ribosomal protein S5]-alanine N-acetyltransferase